MKATIKSNNKSLITVCFFVFSLLFIASPAVSAQAGQGKDLAAKCVAAMGGPKAIEAFSNYEAKGNVKVTFGPREISGTMTLLQQGRKSYQKAKISAMGQDFIVVEAFDGKVYWRDMLGNIADQPTLNKESDLDHTMGLLTKPGVKFTMGKDTEVGGKKAAALIAEHKGKKTTFYIDKENFLVLEVVFKDLYFGQNQVKESMEKRIRYQDYKKQGDFLFPYTTFFYLKGKKQIEATFTKVTFNPTVKASLFQRPDKKPDLRFRAERYE